MKEKTTKLLETLFAIWVVTAIPQLHALPNGFKVTTFAKYPEISYPTGVAAAPSFRPSI